MLKLQQLEVAYDESTVIRDITMEVRQGQVVCLMGRNGVGKTTLVKTIMGLLKPKKGTISYEDDEITNKSPTYRSRKGISYVPQGRIVYEGKELIESEVSQYLSV